MNFTDILLLLLASYGMTFTMVYSTIMDITGLRKWWNKYFFFRELFHCSFCTAFYTGILLSIFFIPYGKWQLIFPFISAGAVYSWDRLITLLDEIRNHYDKIDVKRKFKFK